MLQRHILDEQLTQTDHAILNYQLTAKKEMQMMLDKNHHERYDRQILLSVPSIPNGNIIVSPVLLYLNSLAKCFPISD